VSWLFDDLVKANGVRSLMALRTHVASSNLPANAPVFGEVAQIQLSNLYNAIFKLAWPF